jgi:hypothetical protein
MLMIAAMAANAFNLQHSQRRGVRQEGERPWQVKFLRGSPAGD